MPSHLSGDPEVETNGEVLCPRNLIRGPRRDMAGQTLFPDAVVVVLSKVFPGNESTDVRIRIGQGTKKETPKANRI